MLSVCAGHQHRPGAEAVDHRPGKAVFAQQRHPLEGAVEHAEHLLHVGVYIKICVLIGALAGRVGQGADILHLVNAVVLQAAFRIGDEIVVAVFPHQHPRADAVQLAVMAGGHPLLQVPVAVFELHLLPGRDGRVQRINGIQDLFVGAFDPAADKDLAVKLLLPVFGGELPELVDENLGLARCDELAGVDGVHKQLQLGQLKGGLGHIIAAAAPALLYDLIRGVGQVVQRVQVVIDALALGNNAALLQALHQLRDTQGVLFVRFAGEDVQKDKQFAFLAFFARHSNGSFPAVNIYSPIIHPIKGEGKRYGDDCTQDLGARGTAAKAPPASFAASSPHVGSLFARALPA